ncbi:hypothetical protein PAXRUDRAFT_19644 [Paxillus rubicundulus Ve08.2h10]|uniref:Uncharacterized protein n=1 Tax=Paxillus rubicundulus Ve08.2h10 TaxID=930991 RepID=A0A0D0CHF8_9AGAM|nr:hypothetical protein PAXRUDRAFT_19644 [Paxillus rubicundulus Ve08.2h10]
MVVLTGRENICPYKAEENVAYAVQPTQPPEANYTNFATPRIRNSPLPQLSPGKKLMGRVHAGRPGRPLA